MSSLSMHYDLNKPLDKAKFDVAQNALGYKRVVDKVVEIIKRHSDGDIPTEVLEDEVCKAAQGAGFGDS